MSGQVLERDVIAPPIVRRPAWSRKRMALIGAALAIGLGAAWYGHDWWTVGRFIETTDDAYVGGDVTAISSHVAGFVARIAVADNQYVHAGQLLVRMDDRDYRAALDHAEAVVREREAALASLGAKYALQQSAIRQAGAELAARTAKAAFTGQDSARYAILARTSAGSRQAAEQALAADKEADSAVASARAGLDAARQQLAVLDTETAQARAAVVQAEADLQAARLQLGYTEIRSPVDGYVGNRGAQVGAYVSEGTDLLSIVPARGLWVDANLKEDQLARVTTGERATVTADVLPGHAFHGRVVSVAPATGAIFSVIPAENATGNFTKIVQRVPVRIALDSDDATLGVLRPGLSTFVSVDTREAAK